MFVLRNKSGYLIILLAITLPFISFANVIRTQYLIPAEKDKIYIASVSIGAISNLIANAILIPKLASIGACIGTIAAEFMVLFIQVYSVRKELNIKKYLISTISFFIKAIIMFLIIYSFNYLKMNNSMRIIIQIIIGIFIYTLLNIKYIYQKNAKYIYV